jgi:hypothetical protein
LTAAIVILSLVFPSLRPETGAPHSVEHFTIYGATGFAFGLGYKRRHDLAGHVPCHLLRLHRNYAINLPGRHARLSDFIIDGGMYGTSYGIAPYLSSFAHSMIFDVSLSRYQEI